jgi:hypothetical protein
LAVGTTTTLLLILYGVVLGCPTCGRTYGG